MDFNSYIILIAGVLVGLLSGGVGWFIWRKYHSQSSKASPTLDPTAAEESLHRRLGELTILHAIATAGSEATDEEKEEALTKIEVIREEIVGGADFAEVAKEKSEGPSGPRGGSLGTFTRGQMVGPFEEAAFALEPGELSDIVLTRFGYHIILVEGKTASSMRPLSEVSDQIRQYLTGIEEQDVTATFIAELKEKAEIEYFD